VRPAIFLSACAISSALPGLVAGGVDDGLMRKEGLKARLAALQSGSGDNWRLYSPAQIQDCNAAAGSASILEDYDCENGVQTCLQAI
jgi:hypothetical protein